VNNRTGTLLAWLSILETASFVLLLVMMASGNEGGVSVVGAVHGLLFLAYAALVWLGREPLAWSTRFAIVAIFTGPIGAIIALERLRRDRALARARA
jgi:hypothetical protein